MHVGTNLLFSQIKETISEVNSPLHNKSICPLLPQTKTWSCYFWFKNLENCEGYEGKVQTSSWALGPILFHPSPHLVSFPALPLPSHAFLPDAPIVPACSTHCSFNLKSLAPLFFCLIPASFKSSLNHHLQEANPDTPTNFSGCLCAPLTLRIDFHSATSFYPAHLPHSTIFTVPLDYRMSPMLSELPWGHKPT